MQSNNGTENTKQTIKKISLCKLCSKTKRYANLTLCYGCWKTQEREKRAKKKEARLLRKVKSKKYQLGEWKKWHKKAWKVFSEYIRRRAADWRGYVRCITCGMEYLWNSGMIHAGHFQHDRLDFDTLNVHPQCRNCNYKYRKNIPAIYGVRMVEMYGAEVVNDLIKRSYTKIYSLEELKEIHTKY